MSRKTSKIGVGLVVAAAIALGAGSAQVLAQTPLNTQPNSPPAASAKSTSQAKSQGKAQAAAKPASTPESRSAAASSVGGAGIRRGHLSAHQAALLAYSALEVRGGWPALPASAKLAPGASGPEVALLRRRLAISEDLRPEQDRATPTTQASDDGVRRFQTRHGLTETGSVDAGTLAALNVPVAPCIKHSRPPSNGCSAWMSPSPSATWWCNIPSTFVEAVEARPSRAALPGDCRQDRPAVADPDGLITAVNLNPTWTVPLSIAKNDIFTRMRNDPAYSAHAYAGA